MSALKSPTVRSIARAVIPQAANTPTALAPSPADKGLLRFITCGSVDDGKSTLIGRLMHDAGVIPDDQIDALERDTKKFGAADGHVDYALLVDGLAAEREQGITIDVAYRYFATSRRSFIVADTPGHEQYTRNMATGASTADLAIILIDARKGVLSQTRRHSFIVSLMGVRHIIVAVNKMDLVGWDRAAFNQIEAAYRKAVAPLGFASVSVVPVSAREGENIARRSNLTRWYEGPPLLERLETIDVMTATAAKSGLVFPVQWVNRPNLDFRGYAGTVARGVAQVGAEVIALPSGLRTTIARIVTANSDHDAAVAGQAVTLTLADEIDLSRGDVLASPAFPPRIRKVATARLLWTGSSALQLGQDYLIQIGTTTAHATVDVLHAALDIANFGASSKPTLAMNDIGVATLVFDRTLALADFSESKELGGFILIDRITNETIAFGFVCPDGVESRSISRGGTDVAALVNRAIGRPGTTLRRDRLSELTWRIMSAGIVAAAAWFATANLVLAIALGLADVVLRPILRMVNVRLWMRASRHTTAELNESGGGI